MTNTTKMIVAMDWQDVIKAHQEGIITLDEIKESGRIAMCFGTELAEYVAFQDELYEIFVLDKTIISAAS